MKHFYLILFLSFFEITALQAQPTFQRTYPFTDPVIALNFTATPDGNFLVYATSYNCIFLMKINQSGDTLWTRRFMADYFDIGQLITVHDSGFIITGSWNSGVAVLKVSQYGDSLWMQHYSFQSQFGFSGLGLSIQEMDDHGLFLLNSHDDTDIVYYDIQFMKLDSIGNLIWEKSYNLGHDIINLGYLVKLSSSSYIAQVRRAMGGPSSPYGRLLRVDTAGNILSNSPTNETGRRGGDFIAETVDSNFFMIGNSRNFWDDDPYGTMYKLNNAGFISWSIAFPGTAALNSVAADSAGGCMVACDTFHFSSQDFLLKRFDPNGQMLSSKTYTIDHNEIANAVHMTPDKGFMAVGHHRMATGLIETYIVKTDSSGNLNTNGYTIEASDSFLCTGDTITLSVQAADDYLWSDGQSTQSITVTENGSYNVRVLDSLGATYYTTFVQVTFLEVPQPYLGDDVTTCPGNIITLDPGLYTSYLWQDSSTGPTFDATTAGTYSVTVTSFNGCSNTDTIQVSEYPQPILSLGNDTSVCFGSLLVLHPGNWFQYYEWQDGSGDSVYIVSSQGNYFLSVTDTNGCMTSDLIQITYNPLPQVSLGSDTIICITQSIVLDPGGNFSNYLWVDGSTTEALTASSLIPDSITYFVTVTDSNSCSGTDTIMVVFDLCEGISPASESGILISPNPFSRYIHIIIPASFNTSARLTIFNTSGDRVFEKDLEHNEVVDVSSFSEGIYFLHLRSGDKFILEKVVKLSAD